MSYQIMSEDFTATGNGTPLDMTLSPQNMYALQVVVPSGIPVLWTVILEGSLDGLNWDTLISHTEALGIAKIVFSPSPPTSWMRFRVPVLSLGTSSKITAYALAMD